MGDLHKQVIWNFSNRKVHSPCIDSTIKLKPVDVRSNTYIDSSKEINDKDPKFKLVILL